MPERKFEAEGAPILLIHGLGVDHRMWALQVPHLQHLGRVCALDLPGFGKEPPLDLATSTLEDYVRWLGERADVFGEEPLHLVGYSMGGTLALLLALERPERVRSLALCCSPPCWGQGGRKTLAGFFALAGGRLAMEVFQWTVRWGAARIQGDPERLAVVRDMVSRADRGTMLALFRALSTLDLRPRLQAVTVPTLVVGGVKDRLVPPSQLRLLAAALPAAELHLAADASHLLCLSHASWLSQVLCGFLESQPDGAVKTPAPPPVTHAAGQPRARLS